LGEIKEITPRNISKSDQIKDIQRHSKSETDATEAARVKEYMKTFSKNIKKKETPRKEENNSDDVN